MSYRKRTLVVLGLAIALMAPVALAQKPPGGPPPPPPPPPGNRSAPPSTTNVDAIQPTDDVVMFLSGRIATADGAPLPGGTQVERICNNTVRQQAYPFTKGEFNMQLGSRTATNLDASANPGQREGLTTTRRDSDQGIPRRELMSCEIRATVPGYQPVVASLMGLEAVAKSMDLGVLVARRSGKVDGTTLNAGVYRAPKDARTAYERGVESEKKGKLAAAQTYFEKAVAIYPKFAEAWFQLGSVLQKEKQRDAASKAYAQAATVDSKFGRPFLALASMAFDNGNWSEVLSFTRHLLDLDPFKHNEIGGYVLDLDPLDYSEAYFYDAFANYRLNRFEEAEKSGLKAERTDLRPRFPRIHLLLAELYARKGNYASAASEAKTYLELVPHAKDAVRVRERLAEFERLSGAVATSEAPAPR